MKLAQDRWLLIPAQGGHPKTKAHGPLHTAAGYRSSFWARHPCPSGGGAKFQGFPRVVTSRLPRRRTRRTLRTGGDRGMIDGLVLKRVCSGSLRGSSVFRGSGQCHHRVAPLAGDPGIGGVAAVFYPAGLQHFDPDPARVCLRGRDGLLRQPVWFCHAPGLSGLVPGHPGAERHPRWRRGTYGGDGILVTIPAQLARGVLATLVVTATGSGRLS